MTELVLESKYQPDQTPIFAVAGSDATLSMTPKLDEDYWAFRVKLGDTGQAVIGFPKFFTIGIGFAKEEEDWNTNLPYICDTDEILRHIMVNKGDESISDEDVRQAIVLIQGAAHDTKDQWFEPI